MRRKPVEPSHFEILDQETEPSGKGQHQPQWVRLNQNPPTSVGITLRMGTITIEVTDGFDSQLLGEVIQVYLAVGPTDLRKSIDCLSVIVQEHFQLDTFSRGLYVFCNRLFELERELPEDRYTARLEQSRPVLEAFLAWLKENKPPPFPSHPWEKPLLTA
ncbi:Transposase IS66 family protein [Anoxynatronum buryatiense]|uniref:Transposase IS66 family protein n=1 Tax=Anoxynatronum buryatiense TaxID=489973 RepID=A0AA46AK15_9CLOT|nr:Transposase IS66 family protein [Anoxynatronum buryatiense]